jgi:uncharacterized protein (TIGR00255 family)
MNKKRAQIIIRNNFCPVQIFAYLYNLIAEKKISPYNPFMKSMTGYGSVRLETETSLLEVSIRTINGRFLEPRFHLPRELVGVESILKRELSLYFRRGTIDIFVSRKDAGQKSNLKLILHEDLAAEWLAASQTLSKKFKLRSKLDMATLLQLPDVVRFEEQEEGLKKESKMLIIAFKRACQKCQNEREREGKALQIELIMTVERLKTLVDEMANLRNEASASLKDRFESKVMSRFKDMQLDPQRLYQEVVIQLEKADIQEEISRLVEHMKHFEELLKSSESEGKKLDFYTQELLREVNTIGSKSQLTPLTKIVVLAKTEVEKIREQVQNIE